MKKYKVIVVYSNPPILPIVAALASKLFKCRLIFVAYDLYPEIALRTNSLSQGSIVTKVMNYINKIVYKQSNAVVALSSEMKDYIVNNRNIDDERVHVIHNWYKDQYNQKIKDSENIFYDLVKDRLVIAYFGNMGIAQDMLPIKEALKYFKDDSEICFILAGHGSQYSEIEQLIFEENIKNVYLYKFLRDKEYLDALRISDCAIVTLKKGLTGLCVPSKTYGYMMQGLPIIAIMDESDIITDVKNGAGYYISDNSANELINVICSIKENPSELYIKMQVCREIYLSKYTPEISLEKYARLVKENLR